jgi:hypothetical protein
LGRAEVERFRVCPDFLNSARYARYFSGFSAGFLSELCVSSFP